MPKPTKKIAPSKKQPRSKNPKNPGKVRSTKTTEIKEKTNVEVLSPEEGRKRVDEARRLDRLFNREPKLPTGPRQVISMTNKD